MISTEGEAVVVNHPMVGDIQSIDGGGEPFAEIFADGKIEASFRVTPERFAEGLGAWLTQRGKGEGEPVRVEVTPV